MVLCKASGAGVTIWQQHETTAPFILGSGVASTLHNSVRRKPLHHYGLRVFNDNISWVGFGPLRHGLVHTTELVSQLQPSTLVR